MTLPLHDDEAPRLAEIGRRISEVSVQLSDFRHEVRIIAAEMVRKETYVAERDALKDRILALESRSKSLQNLIYSCIGAVIVGVVSFLILGEGA